MILIEKDLFDLCIIHKFGIGELRGERLSKICFKCFLYYHSKRIQGQKYNSKLTQQSQVMNTQNKGRQMQQCQRIVDLNILIHQFLMERISQYENELQTSSVISRKKNQVVKFYATKTKINIKVKYFHIQAWSPRKVDFYTCSLSNVNYILSNPFQSKLKFNIKVDVSEIRIYVQDKFIQVPNLQKVLSNIELKIKESKQLILDDFKKKVPFYLLDCFLKTIDMNSLILNQSNLYLEPNQIIPNLISFTGVDLIVFQQDVKKEEFFEIFNFIDSNIFDRKPGERLSHKQKIKNFAAMLLTMIVNSPIRLLKNTDVPQIVTFSKAKQLVKKSPTLYRKYLNIRGIKKIIEQKGKQINPNLNFLNFFHKILVQQEDISWSQIKDELTFTQIDNKEGSYIYDFAYQLWKKISANQRQYFCDKRIVKFRDQKAYLGTSSQLFFIIMLGEKISSLKDGSIISELSQKKFDMKSYRIVCQYAKLVNYTIDKSSQWISLAESNERIRFYEQIIRNINNLKSQQDQRILTPEQHSRHLNSRDQASTQICESEPQFFSSFNQIQQEQQEAEHIFFQTYGIVMCKQRKLNEIYKKYQSKLINCFEWAGKNLKIEHELLKSLKAFEYALR